MPGIFVGYAGEDTSRKRSDAVFQGIDTVAIDAGAIGGRHFRDDFEFIGNTGERYTLVEVDGSIAGLTGEPDGVVRLTTGGTDNDECYIGGGINEFVIANINAGKGRMAVEFRVRPQEILDQGIYVGLGEEAFGAANALVDATGALVGKDFVGFSILTAKPAEFDAVYQTAGGTARVVHKEIAATIVANTWLKLGIAFIDPLIFWFVNGKVVDAAGVKESIADFPDGEEMHVQFGIKTGEGTTKRLDIDWWEFAQLDDP